jgi:anti-sigma B factor antagonist
MSGSQQHENLEMSVEVSEGTAEVAFVSPAVDVYTAPQLRTFLAELIEDEHVERLVTDCGNLEYIDSTGLGVFVGALKRARAAEKELTLHSLTPRVQKVFEVTGLAKIFVVEPVEPQA